MLTVSTYVAPSAIEGLGVFAGEFIERGRLMWSLNPKFDIFIYREEIEGQGANCAFEDVVELDRCLDETGRDWAATLPLFEHRRRENTEAIAALALDNFVEMRDKVASPVFRLGKRVEHAIERWAPEHFESLYELVSFTTVPYAEARRRAAAHRRFPATVASRAAAGATRGVDLARQLVRREPRS